MLLRSIKMLLHYRVHQPFIEQCQTCNEYLTKNIENIYISKPENHIFYII